LTDIAGSVIFLLMQAMEFAFMRPLPIGLMTPTLKFKRAGVFFALKENSLCMKYGVWRRSGWGLR
jgi:hypothetical protein